MRQSLFRFGSLFKGAAAASALAFVPSLAMAQNTQSSVYQYNSISGLTQLIKDRDALHPLPKGATDPLGARLQYLRKYAFPNDTIDGSSIDLARQDMLTVPRATVNDLLGLTSKAPYAASKSSISLVSALSWQNLGPNNLDPPYRIYWGPWSVSGRISALAFDPVTPGTYYLGAAVGGIWKTTDAGVTWTPKFNTQPGQAVNSIAVDPVNPNIVYAGTGDNDASDSYAFGLWRSLDGGTTWSLMGADPTDPTNVSKNRFGSHTVRKVVIDPADATGKTILVATGFDSGFARGGIWRTTTGGKNLADWTAVQAGAANASFSNIVMDANPDSTKQVFFASCDRVGIYKSVNRGVTWTGPLGGGAPANNEFRLDIATSRLDPQTVYVLSSAQTSLFKTTDGGTTWKDITSPFLRNADWGQSFYDFHLATSSQTLYPGGGAGVPPGGISSDVVYVGLIDLFQSTNGGISFASAGLTPTNGALTHNDQHSFAVNPKNPNDMLVGNDGGVYHYVYNPQVNTSQFIGLNKTLNISQFNSVASSPTDPLQLLGGTQDNATPHLDGDRLHWKNPGAGDGFAVLMNPTDPLNVDKTKRGFLHQYNSSQGGGISFTDDDWTTKGNGAPAYANDVPGFATILAMSPTDPNTVYTGFQYLYTGTHVPPVAPATLGTITWTEGTQLYCSRGNINDPAPFDTPFVRYITCITPSARGPLYVGTDDGRVWAGAVEIEGGLPRSAISSITVSPSSPTRIYVTLSSTGNIPHVWRCDDTTATFPRWVNISGNLPRAAANALAVAPHDDELQLFVGTELGLFVTNDGGATWKDAGSGLGFPTDVPVRALNYVPSTGFLNVATFGRGMWQFQTGSNQSLQLYLTLQNYRGSRSKISVKAEFYPVGTAPAAGAVAPAAQETRVLNLSASGWFTLLTSSSGTFDVRVKPVGFLSRLISSLRVGVGQTVSPLFLAGDCNPIFDTTGMLTGYGDNAITMADVMWVQSHLGRYSTGPEDVDGDGIVTQRDLDLVTANLGQRGN